MEGEWEGEGCAVEGEWRRREDKVPGRITVRDMRRGCGRREEVYVYGLCEKRRGAETRRDRVRKRRPA